MKQKTKKEQFDKLLEEFKELVKNGSSEEIQNKQKEIKDLLNQWVESITVKKDNP